MKNFTLTIQKKAGLMILALLATGLSYGASFHAATSGNFSSSATWSGGIVPPITVLLDTVFIQSGVTVNLDNNLTISGALAQLNVAGTLTSTNSSSLTVTAGSLAGAGTIVLNTVDVNAGAAFMFTGSLTANTLNAATGIQSSAHLIVNQTLNLTSGALSLVSGGNLTVSNNGTIVIAGGSVGVGSGGSVSLTGNYNVTYTGVSAIAGVELTGSGLNNVNVNVNSIGSVTLASNLTVNGTLALTSGTLILAGSNLTLNGAVAGSGTGTITSTAASALTLNTSAGIASLILVGPVGNLTVNAGIASSVTLGSNATVAGTLTLQSGTLTLNGYDLTINGNVAATGTGTISSTSASDLTIATLSSTAGALHFAATANTVGNLNVNVASNGSASIGSNLNVNGTLNFTGGTLNIGGNALVIGASGSITGTSALSYIITTAGGYVEMHVTAGAAALSFPLGTNTHYAPANILLNAGSASGQVQAGVVDNVLAMGTTGVDISAVQPVVDATWNIHSDISSNLNLTLQVLWSAAMEVNGFNHASAYISHFTGGSWNTSTAASATAVAGGMFSLQLAGLTSLSPFSVFDQNTTTAVAEVNNDVTFNVYPNPATDNIIIQNATASTDAMNVELYNATGQLMGNYKLTAATSTILVKNFVSGTYFIKFYNNKMSSTKSFIKM